MSVRQKDTLCWKCANACCGCSWSENFIPVKGWKAQRTKVYHTDSSVRRGETSSYVVLECPEFVSDVHKYKTTGHDQFYQNRYVQEVLNNPQYNNPEARMNKSDARKRVEAIPEEKLKQVIENNLHGSVHDVAILALLGKMTTYEIAAALFFTPRYVRYMISKAVKKISAIVPIQTNTEN